MTVKPGDPARGDAQHQHFVRRRARRPRRSIDLFPGELVGLVGHNGAGKTTLMRALSGAHPADTGEILIGGKVCTRSGRRSGRRSTSSEGKMNRIGKSSHRAFCRRISRSGACPRPA